MDEFDVGPPEGNDPSLPPRGDGNDGDGKKANSKASAATSKAPGDRGDGDGDKDKSEAETWNTVVLLEEPQETEAVKETEAVNEAEAGQRVSEDACLSSSATSEDETARDCGETAQTRKLRAGDIIDSLPTGWVEKRLPSGRVYYVDHNTRTTQWEHPGLEMHVPNMLKPGFEKNEEPMSTKPAVGSSGNFDKGARKHPIQVEDHAPSPYQQAASRAGGVHEETDTSQPQSLVAKPHVQAQSSEVVAMSQPTTVEQLGDILSTKLKLVGEDFITQLDRRDKARYRQLEDAHAKQLHKVKEENAEHRREMNKEYAGHLHGMKEANAEHLRKLEKERDADKRGNERMQVTVTQLSEELDSAREDMKRLRQQLRAEKHGNEEMRKQARKKGDEVEHMKERLEQLLREERQVRDDFLEENERLEQQLREERQVSDDFLEENERLEQQLREERQVSDQLRERLAELNEDCGNFLKEIKRLSNELAAAKPHVPRTKSEYLDPFTGYAIVMSNAIMEYDDDTEIVLNDTKRLAKALFDYGFEVKPMRNASLLELMQGIQKCKERKEPPGLVFIYIAAHGDSTGIEMEEEKPRRDRIALKLPKPTILCVMACRHHSENDPSTFVDNLLQDGVFFVDACQQGCTCNMIRDTAFVTGLVKIFQDHDPHGRSFSTAIEDLREQYPKLDSKNRLSTPLVLPPYPARTWPDDVRRETNQALNNAFQYPEPADEHSNST